jgi:dTDP-4-amino-4,6-dideoxygalactose transaminase
MVNQEKLRYLKDTYNILILEDCAHAIGAIDGTAKAGSCKNSDISILSFHPVKHMTTGEGGAVTTNSESMYKKLMMLRGHGMVKTPEMKPWEYEMRELGFNYRITDIQCALGISQLKKLDGFIERRLEIAKVYDKAFEQSIVKPLYRYDGKSSYHLYVVQVDFTKLKLTKVDLFNLLREKNIGIMVHYIPINKQPYYKKLGYGGENTPVMDRYYEECFSLPIYPKLEKQEQKHVIKTILGILRDHEK